MSQLDYSVNTRAGQPGLKADMGFDNVKTFAATSVTGFGLGIMQGHLDNLGNLPAIARCAVVLDAPLITGNTINLTVNGTALAIPFNTDSPTTLNDLAEAIEALDDVTTFIPGANMVGIVYTGNDELKVTGASVTGGATQAGVTLDETTSGDFVGITLVSNTVSQDLNSNAAYQIGDAMNVLSRGRVYVYAETDLMPGVGEVYVRIRDGGANEKRGQFRNNDASGDAVKAPVKVITSAKAGGLAVIEVNLP